MVGRIAARISGLACFTLIGIAILFGTPSGAVAQSEPKVLNVYNWSDYIAADTIAKFEAETGIKVNYDVYDGNEVLEAKLLAGKSGYDIVVPTTNFMARQIQAKVYRPIDKAKLSNYGNLDPQVLKNAAAADPGNKFGVPYLWGTTGFGYNVAKIKAVMPDAPIGSLAMIFDPNVVKNFKDCGVSVLDTPQEMIPAALAYLGRKPLSRDEKDLNAAVDAILKIRPYIKKFHSSQYISDLANGDLCVAFGYSGDIVQARTRAEEAKNGNEIAYTIPKEGAMMWIDMMGIPADAPHPGNAHTFINFILRPQIIGDISNFVAYANPNLKSADFVDEAIKTNENIYPPKPVMAKLFFDTPVTQAYERLRTRAWTRIKSGS